MNLLCRFLVVGLLCLGVGPGLGLVWAAPAAVVVEGERFGVQSTVSGSELVLNGTGVRAVAWFKGYVAGLYLPHKAQSVDTLLALPGPRRLQLRMLQDVPAAEFVKALHKGMERNAPAAEWLALRDRVERLSALITEAGKVRMGDVVNLDLDPTQGMLFSLNGTLRGQPIEGLDFYNALLRAFIGDKPYDERLRAGLLGRP